MGTGRRGCRLLRCHDDGDGRRLALSVAACQAGHKVRYFTAAGLVETLFRALADNSVGKTIETLLRHDLIIVGLWRPRNYADAGRTRLRAGLVGAGSLARGWSRRSA